MSSINIYIDLNFDQLVEAVKQLSLEEKSNLNDVLWNENMEVPLSQQTIVLDRMKKAKKDPSRLLDWEEVAKSLKG